MSVLPLDLFDPDEVGDLGDHAPDLGAVVLDHRVVETVQAEPADRGLLVLRPVDAAADLGHLKLRHRTPPGRLRPAWPPWRPQRPRRLRPWPWGRCPGRLCP